MAFPIITKGSIVVSAIQSIDGFGNCIELFIAPVPEGSEFYRLRGDCIEFAVLGDNGIGDSGYVKIPSGAKTVYIPDLKNLEEIYFIKKEY